MARLVSSFAVSASSGLRAFGYVATRVLRFAWFFALLLFFASVLVFNAVVAFSSLRFQPCGLDHSRFDTSSFLVPLTSVSAPIANGS